MNGPRLRAATRSAPGSRAPWPHTRRRSAAGLKRLQVTSSRRPTRSAAERTPAPARRPLTNRAPELPRKRRSSTATPKRHHDLTIGPRTAARNGVRASLRQLARPESCKPQRCAPYTSKRWCGATESRTVKPLLLVVEIRDHRFACSVCAASQRAFLTPAHRLGPKGRAHACCPLRRATRPSASRHFTAAGHSRPAGKSHPANLHRYPLMRPSSQAWRPAITLWRRPASSAPISNAPPICLHTLTPLPGRRHDRSHAAAQLS